MARLFLILGSLAGLLAVVLGAFGAHALKERLSPEMLEVYHTGVSYQFYHALALLAVGLLLRQGLSGSAMTAAGFLFTAGILMFSGSLYGLALTGWKWLGPVTPLGGLCFIIGWACLLVAVARSG
jgi:uncharacterized membrane protein YgdD (TMEM256/DUF423 family)